MDAAGKGGQPPMSSRWLLRAVLAAIVPLVAVSAGAGHCSPGSSGTSGFGRRMPTANVPAAVSGSRGWASYPFPYYATTSANGVPIVLVPAVPVVVPTVFVAAPPVGAGMGGHGLAGPLPPGGVPVARARFAQPP